MYIFDRVIAKVVETGIQRQQYRTDITFYRGRDVLPFSAAKKVADEGFLTDRIAQLEEAYRQQKVGTEIELTREEGPGHAASRIRGYQGGLVHFVNSAGHKYLVLPLRKEDAPSSPLMLDIQAGRLNLDNAEEAQWDWRDFLVRRGVEVGYFTSTHRLIPILGEGMGRQPSYGKQMHDKYLNDSAMNALDKLGIAIGLRAERNIFPVTEGLVGVSVYPPGFILPNQTFKASWAALPWLSSIELMQYVTHHFPRGMKYTDLQFDNGTPMHRDIYVVNCETGTTEVWNAGMLKRTDSIATLLDENLKLLEDKISAGTLRDAKPIPVSPKVKAVLLQLPYPMNTWNMQGIQPLLQF